WSADGLGSSDDAGLRRLRRKHPVGQHLAAPPPEHQTTGLRGGANRQPLGPDGIGKPGGGIHTADWERAAAVRTSASTCARRDQRRRALASNRRVPRYTRLPTVTWRSRGVYQVVTR